MGYVKTLMKSAADWMGWGSYVSTDPGSSRGAMAQIFDRAGVKVTPRSSHSLPVYFACARNLAEDLAKMPLVLNRRMDTGKERAKDHPLYDLLRYEPNPRMGSESFRETMTFHALTWHGGFAHIVRNGAGEVVELNPIHPSRVYLDRQSDGSMLYKVMMGDNRPGIILRDDEMFHLHGMGPEGDTGYSMLELHSESVGIGLASQHFAASFYRNGTNLSGVFTIPGDLPEATLAKMQTQISERATGAKNWLSNMILYNGMEYKPLAIPPDQAQFIESRQFQVEEICRWFRMPPSKVQQSLRAEGWSTLEQKNTDYYTDALMPWDVRWTQEIRRKLLRGSEKKELFAEHLFSFALRADETTQVEVYRKYFEMGLYSQNEIREIRNLSSIGPDGDKRYVPVNLRPIDLPWDQKAETPPPAASGDDPNGDNSRGANQVDNNPVIARLADATAARIVARQIKSRAAKKGAPDLEDQSAYMLSQIEPWGRQDAPGFVQSYVTRWFSTGNQFDAAGAASEIQSWLRGDQ